MARSRKPTHRNRCPQSASSRKPRQGSSSQKPIAPGADLSRLKLYSVHDRSHISQIDAFARAPAPGASFREWFDSLPGFLGAIKLRSAVEAIVAARAAAKPVVFAMGGHVVKVGCGPVVIDLLRRGIVTAAACHGATAIHDVEIAMLGATSEEVADTIRDGRFGMVRETMEFFAEAAHRAVGRRTGYGRAIGRLILERKLPHAEFSILAAAAELDLPATVHVAVGTDTVHMSGQMDGAALGEATMQDFRLLCSVVRTMGHKTGQPGGVWCNIGSAVLLPEVFLKAMAVARNLGTELDNLTAINLDMLRHYRPIQNVVGRPVAPGRGLDIAGHHEILLPLLRQALLEKMPG